MRFRLREIYAANARRLQRAYARVIQSAGPARAPRSNSRARPGGSLREQVLRGDLVSFARWGFAYTPTRIGQEFLWWWRGTRRQPARGRAVAHDTDGLAAELEEAVVRQVRGEDRRTSR